MAFQPGNKLAKRADHKRPKIFTAALIAALKKTDSEDVEAIQRIADKLVALAAAGDVSAIKEVADRCEGKPPQFSTGDADEFRRAMDLSDDELAAIAAGSGEGAAEAESNPPVTH